ncbi:MAG TPA: hypothetical protein VGQ78_08865 [Vicinamibacteria bacterium]|jgi:hypothetical protein|nr:hypothetical protein [Vicinamibacteria bacterium]
METAFKKVLRAGAVLALMALSGCATKTINKLMADPHRYANRDVRLAGHVVKSVSLLGRGAYQIDDGTGTLWVISKTGVPRRGAHVKVKGKVRDVVDLGSIVPLPPEVGSGLVLMETRHKASF